MVGAYGNCCCNPLSSSSDHTSSRAWRDITGLGLTIISFVAAVFLWRLESQASQPTGSILALAGSHLAASFAGAMLRNNHAAGALAIVALPLVPVAARIIGRNALVSCGAATAAAFVGLIATTLAASLLSSAITQRVQSMLCKLGRRIDWSNLAEVRRNLFPPQIYPRIDLAAIDDLLSRTRSPYRHVFWKAYTLGNNEHLRALTEKQDYEVLSAAFHGR